MEAVAALLRGLPLQPEESDRGDLMEAKSQLFLKFVSSISLFILCAIYLFFICCFFVPYRYFTLFMNLLNDSTENQEEVPLPRQRVQSNKNNTLRQATIQAMSNLLSANIDSGLMHSIGIYLGDFRFSFHVSRSIVIARTELTLLFFCVSL